IYAYYSIMTPKSIEELISQRLVEALATYEANQNNRNLINDDGNEGGNRGGNDNGNGNRGGNGNGNDNGGGNGVEIMAKMREELYQLPKGTVGANVAYAMTWKELMKLMTKVYCPRNEILKMKNEL
nr:hypothetical protein [Tanacetum cinerariifolium]